MGDMDTYTLSSMKRRREAVHSYPIPERALIAN